MFRLIFNNGWTCTILNTWSHCLVQLVAPCFTQSTRLYNKRHDIAESEICSTDNVMFTLLVRLLCLYSTLQSPDGQTTFESTGIVCEKEINPFKVLIIQKGLTWLQIKSIHSMIKEKKRNRTINMWATYISPQILGIVMKQQYCRKSLLFVIYCRFKIDDRT